MNSVEYVKRLQSDFESLVLISKENMDIVRKHNQEIKDRKEYLAGYTEAARQIAVDKAKHGWAMAKGILKKRIQFWARIMLRMDTWTHGWIDAHLDSVN